VGKMHECWFRQKYLRNEIIGIKCASADSDKNIFEMKLLEYNAWFLNQTKKSSKQNYWNKKHEYWIRQKYLRNKNSINVSKEITCISIL
jgi:hypothetical protein